MNQKEKENKMKHIRFKSFGISTNRPMTFLKELGKLCNKHAIKKQWHYDFRTEDY